MEKTKNCWVIPTDKPSRLYYNNNDEELQFCEVFRKSTPLKENKNIYITSDEEIKEGDVVKIPCGVGKVKKLNWKVGNDNPSYIVEDIFIYKLRYGQKKGELQINSFRYEDVKKIVFTTDQELIKDSVQAIDDEFLEWFVKNPSCEYVKVEKEARDAYNVSQERMYSEDDMIMFADFFHNYKELLKKEKWEILEISKEDVFKKWKQI